jgi:hypothetical protein
MSSKSRKQDYERADCSRVLLQPGPGRKYACERVSHPKSHLWVDITGLGLEKSRLLSLMEAPSSCMR